MSRVGRREVSRRLADEIGTLQRWPRREPMAGRHHEHHLVGEERFVHQAAAAWRGGFAHQGHVDLAGLQGRDRVAAVKRLRPPIAEVFGFDEVPAAFAHYARGEAFGKVVVRVGDGTPAAHKRNQV
jgi:hypothetical protein